MIASQVAYMCGGKTDSNFLRAEKALDRYGQAA